MQNKISEDSILTNFGINSPNIKGETKMEAITKLVKNKLTENRSQKSIKIDENRNQEREYSPDESSYQNLSKEGISEYKNISEIVKEGFDNVFKLMLTEDKTEMCSYVVTFILSLTEEQLKLLNIAIQVIKTSMQTQMHEVDLGFVNRLTPFQFDLFKKSRIWTLTKDSYLKTDFINPSLSANQRRRVIHTLEIDYSNLIIIEYSPLYDQEVLKREREEDEDFLNKITEAKGTEIFNCLLPEQLRIFENVVNYNYPMKYFTSTIKENQIEMFQKDLSRISPVDGNSNIDDSHNIINLLNEEEEASSSGERPSIDYKNELYKGIQRIDNLEVFRSLTFYIPEHFEGKDLDEIKEDILNFVDSLKVNEAKELWELNPVLVSSSALNSFVKRLNDSQHHSSQDLSIKANKIIFFEDQTEKEYEKRHGSYKDLHERQKNWWKFRRP